MWEVFLQTKPVMFLLFSGMTFSFNKICKKWQLMMLRFALSNYCTIPPPPQFEKGKQMTCRPTHHRVYHFKSLLTQLHLVSHRCGCWYRQWSNSTVSIFCSALHNWITSDTALSVLRPIWQKPVHKTIFKNHQALIMAVLWFYLLCCLTVLENYSLPLETFIPYLCQWVFSVHSSLI